MINIKIWLIQNDMTRQQLADKLGITYKTLSGYINGTTPKYIELALKGIEYDKQ